MEQQLDETSSIAAHKGQGEMISSACDDALEVQEDTISTTTAPDGQDPSPSIGPEDDVELPLEEANSAAEAGAVSLASESPSAPADNPAAVHARPDDSDTDFETRPDLAADTICVEGDRLTLAGSNMGACGEDISPPVDSDLEVTPTKRGADASAGADRPTNPRSADAAVLEDEHSRGSADLVASSINSGDCDKGLRIFPGLGVGVPCTNETNTEAAGQEGDRDILETTSDQEDALKSVPSEPPKPLFRPKTSPASWNRSISSVPDVVCVPPSQLNNSVHSVATSESSLEFIIGVVQDRADAARSSLSNIGYDEAKTEEAINAKAAASIDPNLSTTVAPVPPTSLHSKSSDDMRSSSADGLPVGAHRVTPQSSCSELMSKEEEEYIDALLEQFDSAHGDIEMGVNSTRTTIEESTPGAYAECPSMSNLNQEQPEPTETNNGPTLPTELPPGMFTDGRSARANRAANSETQSVRSQVLLEATLVEDDVRSLGNVSLGNVSHRSNKILVLAVPMTKCCTCHWQYCPPASILLGFLSFLVCFALTMGLAFGLGLQRPSTTSGMSQPNATAITTTTTVPTLQQIQERGVLHCGVGSISPALHFFDETGERSGFDVALCRALAAAVLGEDAQVKFTLLTFKGRFPALSSNEVDVIAAGATHSMERQVLESESKMGFSFSAPYLYEGLHFAGNPSYVACVEGGILRNTGVCFELSVCTIDGTSHNSVLSRLLPGTQLIALVDYNAMVQGLVDGTCNVVAHEGHQLQEASIRGLGYVGAYAIGSDVFSKEPLALVTRKCDLQWSKFVNMILQSLFLAEKHEITRETAYAFPQSNVFGVRYSNMFRHAIAVGGNYGELYDQYLEPILPRHPFNMINDSSQNPLTATGLMFSHPMGSTEATRDANVGDAMDQIQLRGTIRCGLVMRRPGFAVRDEGGAEGYQGIELDLCKALSAALFSGFTDKIEILPVGDEKEGYAALEEGKVDVFAGASWNYLSYSHEKADDGCKLSFSPPYFYNEDSAQRDHQENLCLVTTANDHNWSSFVYWIVSGLFYAEEEGITMEDANEMPEINLFGPGYSRMLRDVILTFGNMGHLYEKNLEAIYPRQGRNLLNSRLNPGPQHYPIPGLTFDV